MKLPKTFLPDKDLGEKVEEMLNPKKRKFKYAPKFNTLKSCDERVQHFYDLWCEEAFTSTDSQRVLLAESYCIHVLGVSEKIFREFENWASNKGDKSLGAEHEIGMRQGGALERKCDFNKFWTDVETFFPSDYSQEDLDLLIEWKFASASMLIYQFETFSAHPVFRALRTNAHVYK